MSGIVAVFHLFCVFQMLGSSEHKEPYMTRTRVSWRMVDSPLNADRSWGPGSHAPGQTLWFLRVLTFQDTATHLFVLTAQTLRFLLQNWRYIYASSLQGMSWGSQERILSCRNQNLSAYEEHQPHCKATNSSSEGCEHFCTLQTSHFH